jgi:DNA polymerase-3 subunit epsilon/ATP-dependent DNA helicase DinG
MDSIVALDLETTGLDSERDAIIEIGLVRFNKNRVEREWASFANPGRPIPPFITQLTGITDRMVREAPPLRELIPDIKHLIGDSPVLGHNVRFDLGFLRRHGILGSNDAIDTYELASVLMPGAERYNLAALAQALSVPLPATHRALEDARVTRAIYIRLLDQAIELPIQLLAEIVRMSESVEWDGYTPLREALRARAKETISARQVRHGYAGPIFDTPVERSSGQLTPKKDVVPIDPDDAAAVLEYGGAFQRYFPSYEFRPQQVDMLRAVARSLSEGRHLFVEAGPGTGKSIAYLIPAALWAMQNNTRVVISTNTINLQEQLIHKDIPDLTAALQIDLHFAVLKGRSNYLCPRRLEAMRRRGPADADEMRVLAKALVWLQSSQSGDRVELNLNGPVEREIWSRLCAEDEGCTTENCIKRTGGICPFYRARQAAQNAHLLVVNHALLLADVTTGNRVLPEYNHLVIDEAHHLEEATTNALSFNATQGDILRALRELGGPNAGALGWMLTTLQGVLEPADYAALNQLVDHAADYAFQFENLSRQFFEAIQQFLFEQREGAPIGPYAHQERILPATRTQPAWADVEVAWDEAERTIKSLKEILVQCTQAVGELIDALPEEGEDLFSTLSNLYVRFSAIHDHLNALVFEPMADRIYWVELQPNGRNLSLHSAPLHIGPLMERYLWHEKSSVILTSATLTTAGEFDYLRGRLNGDEADEVALGSPFDYENAALIYIVNDIPEPGDRNGHQRGVERGLIDLCIATGGRTLVLFTSYDQLRRTSQAIGSILGKHDIQVYEQGEGASPHILLETFRSTERAVLLGTRAFWEGVDVPGEALSVLVIVKLPFDVPTDPIVAARAETFEDSFYQYSLPEAILRFRQGFGRLIRTQSDRGVFAILDRRILTKPYGRFFLDSLPACTLKAGTLVDLPRTAAKWLNL